MLCETVNTAIFVKQYILYDLHYLFFLIIFFFQFQNGQERNVTDLIKFPTGI